MTEPTRRIGYTVVGGFLGAGKTTWLNGRLEQADGRRLAVVVNDFGDVNVDAALLGERTTAAGGRIVELTNGCACCTAGSSLSLTLRDLATGVDGPVPDEIIVEASGAADPSVIAGYGSRRVMAEAEVLVLVDVTRIVDLLEDARVAGLVAAQLRAAGTVVWSRLDLATDTQVADAVAAVDSVVAFGAVPAAPVAPAAFATASFQVQPASGDLLVDRIREGVAEVRRTADLDRVLRVKGVVDTGDGLVSVQAVDSDEIAVEPLDARAVRRGAGFEREQLVGRVVVIGTTACSGATTDRPA